MALLLLVTTVFLSLSRFRAGWSAQLDRLSRVLVISIDLQFLMGLALYFILHLQTTLTMSETYGNKISRFWAVEHPFGMILAIALIHVGKVKVKKAAEERKAKTASIFFGLALLLIFLSIPWPGLPYGRPLLRM